MSKDAPFYLYQTYRQKGGKCKYNQKEIVFSVEDKSEKNTFTPLDCMRAVARRWEQKMKEVKRIHFIKWVKCILFLNK